MKLKRQKIPKDRNPFTTKHKGNVVEVWLGKPDELESEFILAVDQAWLPELIATLKSTGTPKLYGTN